MEKTAERNDRSSFDTGCFVWKGKKNIMKFFGKKQQSTPMDLSKEEQGKKKKRGLEVSLLWFLILQISLVIKSLAGSASKMAGRQKTFSLRFFFFYGLVLAITFLFALVWQQVLKHMSLTFAFTNKPVTMIWGLIWGVTIFQEKVTPKMVLGSAVILIGIIIGVSGNERAE